MTWLAPGFLAAGAAGALAVVALHLLAWRRPRPMPLPTARFVPEARARARAWATMPVDRALLLLRVVALLLVAAAFARPVREAPRAPLARIVLADVSASVGEDDAARAAMRAAVRDAWRPGDALVAFARRALALPSPDSLPERPAPEPGRLSVALVAARDAARALASRADSAELVVVSPLAREEVDAAVPALAAAWGGRARHVAVAPARLADRAPSRVEVRAAGDDPVAAAVDAAALASPDEARLVRRAASGEDDAWLRAAPGRVLVAWPADTLVADGGVAALAWVDDAIVTAVGPTSAPALDTAERRVMLRWADGAPAATERAVAGNCAREVRVALPAAGDVTLAPGFARLLGALVAPCGAARDLATVLPASLGLRAEGAALALPRPTPQGGWAIARWLLAAALALLLAEPLVRRRRDDLRADAAVAPTGARVAA